MQDDADRELKEWQDAIAARELAEKRRVAPGWLDSNARILEPQKKSFGVDGAGETPASAGNLMDVDVSSADASALSQTPVVAPNGLGDELDRAFGGLGLGVGLKPRAS